MTCRSSLFLVFLSFLFLSVVNASNHHSITGTVLSIIDGDTIKIETEDGIHNVRLTGIDTPETHYMGHSQGYWGERASNFLKSRIPVNGLVRVEIGEEYQDGFGRILGTIYFREENINRVLLKEGLACLYVIYPFDEQYLVDYVELAKKAFDEGKGMFNPDNPIEDIPYVFRMKVSNRVPTKIVGDYYTKHFFLPRYFSNIPISRRIFFFSRKDAIEAGYTEAENN